LLILGRFPKICRCWGRAYPKIYWFFIFKCKEPPFPLLFALASVLCLTFAPKYFYYFGAAGSFTLAHSLVFLKFVSFIFWSFYFDLSGFLACSRSSISFQLGLASAPYLSFWAHSHILSVRATFAQLSSLIIFSVYLPIFVPGVPDRLEVDYFWLFTAAIL